MLELGDFPMHLRSLNSQLLDKNSFLLSHYIASGSIIMSGFVAMKSNVC